MSSKVNSGVSIFTASLVGLLGITVFILGFLFLKDKCSTLTNKLQNKSEELEVLKAENEQLAIRDKWIKNITYKVNTDTGSLYQVIPLPKDEQTKLYLRVTGMRSSRLGNSGEIVYLNKVIDLKTGVEYLIQSSVVLPLDKIIETTNVAGFPKLRFLSEEEYRISAQKKI
jgi:hypothetical protein